MVKRIDFATKSSKKKLAAFLGMALVSTVMGISGASAKISLKSINGISKHFKDNKKYCSITLGQVALDAGLIHNLRFFGVEKPGINKKDGSRRYVGDTSSDPVIQLVIDLFPSPGGNLSPAANMEENFGKSATVETVALLLKYADEIRSNKEAYKRNKPQRLGPEHTKAEIAARNREITKYETTHNKTYKKNIEAIKAEFNKRILNKNSELNKRTVNTVLNHVIGSIDQEDLPNSLYPKHTTEQLITAFFCERFENEDVWKLMNALDDDIVDHPLDAQGQRIKLQEPLLDVEKLNEIAHKDLQEPYDMDEIFALENARVFFALTPYKPGTAPVDNASGIKAYNQQTGQFEDATFSDCEETMLRHLLNLIFYNPEIKDFDLSALEALNLPIAANLKAFYAAQTPNQANEGGNLRDLWSRVVGDLNHLPTNFQSPKIEYQKSIDGTEYELMPNLINSINVLQKLFEVDLPAIPTGNIENTRQWITSSFQLIFNKLKLNNKRNYEINATNLTPSEENENMLLGSLAIDVFEEGNPLFYFDLFSNYGKHSYMEQVSDAQQSVDLNVYKTAAQQHPYTFMNQDTEQSLWTLGGAAFADRISHPLYKLFHQKISDNKARIDFLKIVNEQFDDLKSGLLASTVNREHFNTIFQKVLEGISWEDEAILEAVSDTIFALSQHPDLQEVLYKNVKGFKINDLNVDTDVVFEEIKLHFKNIEHLMFRFIPYGELSLNGFENLISLMLPNSGVKKVEGLNTLKNLTTLNLKNTGYLKEISLTGLNNLTSLNISNSGIEKIEGLQTLENLATLNLEETIKLKEISLTGLENLISLNLSLSGVKKIEGLNDLKNLKVLNLDYTDHLSKYDPEGLRNELKTKDYEMIGVDLSQLLLPEERALGPQELLKQGYARQVVAANYYVDELVNAGFHLWELFSHSYTQEEILEAYYTVNLSTVNHDDLTDLTLMAFDDFTKEKVQQFSDEQMREFLTTEFKIPALRQILSANAGTNMYLNKRLFNDDDILKLAEEGKVVLPHSAQISAALSQEPLEEMTLVAPLSQTYTEEITEFPADEKLTEVHKIAVGVADATVEVEKIIVPAAPVSDEPEIRPEEKEKTPNAKRDRREW